LVSEPWCSGSIETQPTSEEGSENAETKNRRKQKRRNEEPEGKTQIQKRSNRAETNQQRRNHYRHIRRTGTSGKEAGFREVNGKPLQKTTHNIFGNFIWFVVIQCNKNQGLVVIHQYEKNHYL
jgi:hypothetical protein